MKELTIEEKAARYDEAIDIARKINSGEGVAASSGWTTCEVIFPELKESKDNKIRKEIIDFIYDKTDTYELRETSNSWLAWLEKQGETFTKKDVDDAYLKGISDAKQEIEKQSEQNPIDVRTIGYWHVENVKQKPAWSENDEYVIERLFCLLDNEQENYPQCDFQEIQEFKDWLKSLKERYTWKPSDEQIRTLDFAIDCTVYPEFNIHRSVLKELLEQLKKLREE